MDKKLIFIVGSPRSGTTLVQSLIMTSDKVESTYETFLFTYLRKINKSKGIIKIKYKIKYLIRFFSIFKKVHIPNNYLKDCKKLCDELIELLTEDKTVYLEKTPSHLYSVNDIRKIYDAKFVFVIRDIDSNAKSIDKLSNQWYKNNQSLLDAKCRIMCDSVYVSEFFNSKDSLIISYNDLTSSQDEKRHNTISNLQNFLELKFDISKLNKNYKNIVKKNESWKSNNQTNEIILNNKNKTPPTMLKNVIKKILE